MTTKELKDTIAQGESITVEFISNQEIRELCGFSKQQARSTIDKMKEEDILNVYGRGKATKYGLKK